MINKGMVDIDLHGDRELLALLRSLHDKLNRKIMMDALKKSADIIKKPAQQNLMTQAAKHGYKGLRKYKNRIAFMPSKRYKTDYVGYVGPKRGTKYAPTDFWFAHFIEYGTSGIKKKQTTRSDVYRRGISGDYAGYVAGVRMGEAYRDPTPAMPFMRPAIEQYGKKAEQDLMNSLRKIVLRTWKRGAKRAGMI